MRITVDGMKMEMSDGASLIDLLSGRGEPLDHVLVELNGRLVRKEDLYSTILSEGDEVEVILPAMGG